jgi:hypothetical protein
MPRCSSASQMNAGTPSWANVVDMERFPRRRVAGVVMLGFGG